MKKSVAVVSLLAALAAATPAEAKVLKFLQGGLTVLGVTAKDLELSGSAAVTVATFRLASRARVAITFSADCVVLPVDTGWAEIDIIVDNVKLPPTDGNNDIFCHANGGANGMHSITIAKTLPAGAHTLRIEGQTHNSATAAVLGDSSLVIMN